MTEQLDKPIRAESLVDKLVERLEEAILSGELAPGSRLSEQGLSLKLNVSRSPLREAIRRLEGKKLVQRIPNFGARVADQSIEDLRDLLIAREALEGMACRYAATSMTENELSGLADLLEQHGKQRGLREEPSSYLESFDVAFHFRIIEGSRNRRLIGMLCDDLYNQLRLYRYKADSAKGRPRQSFEEHKTILNALLSRDPDAAEAAMRAHIAHAREVTLARVAARARS
jgi:DNA-binding GntR family transcriptional regulator